MRRRFGPPRGTDIVLPALVDVADAPNALMQTYFGVADLHALSPGDVAVRVIPTCRLHWGIGGRSTSPEGRPGDDSTTGGLPQKVEAWRPGSCYNRQLPPGQDARPLASPGEARAGLQRRDPYRELAITSRRDFRALAFADA